MKASEMTNVQIADYILSLQSDVDGFPFNSNEIIREAAKRLLTDGDDDISKDAEIAELKDCILKEIDWLKRMIRDDLEGWATSMWSPSDEFRKHTFSRLIEDNTYHIERMKKALKGSNNATK